MSQGQQVQVQVAIPNRGPALARSIPFNRDTVVQVQIQPSLVGTPDAIDFNSHDPFRYCLPQKLAAWKKDPLYQLDQKIRESRNLVLPPLGTKWGASREAGEQPV